MVSVGGRGDREAQGVPADLEQHPPRKADPDAPWARARVSGVELTSGTSACSNAVGYVARQTSTDSSVPCDSDTGGTPQDGDRVRARLWNFDGRDNDLPGGIYPPDLDRPRELQVGTLVIEIAASAWGSYQRHLMRRDDGTIRFIEPAAIVVLQQASRGREGARGIQGETQEGGPNPPAVSARSDIGMPRCGPRWR